MPAKLFVAASTLAAASLAVVVVSGQEAPVFEPISSKVGHFVEQFTDDYETRWAPSQATKGEDKNNEVFSYVGKWQVQEPTVFPAIIGDKALVATSKAAHHAISSLFDTPYDPKAEGGLVVQYEVKLQSGLECGGAYMKLLTESPEGIQALELSDKTPYTIMFGPDRCGATNKVHFIFRHKNPLTGAVEEKHLKGPPAPKNDKLTNLYTLVVRKDNSYEIKINGESKKKGSLLEDFDPAVNPEKEIDDASDLKPADWVDEAKITDPDATKPSDWDESAPFEIEDLEASMPEGWLANEPATIPDPDAQKPEEWSDEDDGDWIAPSVPNPKCQDPDTPGCGPWISPKKPNPEYKGKWYAALIDNPLYKGIWAPKKISNPDYYDDSTPYALTPLAGVAFEWWTMQDGISVDNIYIGSSESDAAAFAAATFDVKYPIELAAEKASKPASDSSSLLSGEDGDLDTSDFSIPAFLADPVNYSRSKVTTFIKVATKNPVGAVKAMPQAAAVVGGLMATLIGMIGILLGLLAPKPAVVKQKAVRAKDATVKKASEIQDATVKKANEIQDATVKKANEVRDVSAQKAGEVQDAASNKANEAQDTTSRRTIEVQEVSGAKMYAVSGTTSATSTSGEAGSTNEIRTRSVTAKQL